MRASALCAAVGLALGGCAGTTAGISTYQPATGVTEIVRGPIAAAPGHQLVTGDIVMAADAPIPPHYHHGEEFLYVIGGSAILSRPGMPDLTLAPGEGLRIPPGTVHSGRAGPDGLRAVATWLVPDGKPLRVPVAE